MTEKVAKRRSVTGPALVLSVCGESAVGKGTLIDRIVADDRGIRVQLCIPGDVGIFADRDKTRGVGNRYIPLSAMFTPPYPDTIVYRWQWVEKKFRPEGGQLTGYEVIQCLRSFFPEANHRVILLWRNWDDHERQRRKVQEGLPPSQRSKYPVHSTWNRKILPLFGPEGTIEQSGLHVELFEARAESYHQMEWADVPIRS